MNIYLLAGAILLGLLRPEPAAHKPTPAPPKERCVHFWHVPELGGGLVRIEGPAVEWVHGQREPAGEWDAGAPCVVCRLLGRRDAWNCSEGNAIWPTHDRDGGGGWCRKAEWLGQVPYREWRAGVLGRRQEAIEDRRPRGRVHELVDILEARK